MVDFLDWVSKALIGILTALYIYQVKKMDTFVTSNEMKEYVNLKTEPLIEALRENTDAIKAMTHAFHSVDKKLDRIEVELEYVKKVNNQ